MPFGGERRRRVLTRALGAHYRSLFRREWILAGEPPHFYDHRLDSFDLLTGDGTPFPFLRGYLAAQVMRRNDRVLDIGCGDGFFDRHFFAPRVREIDAIDIEASAIAHAERHNAAANIRYVGSDAVADPFPAAEYDVVVWDGALGHFSEEGAARVLAKVAEALTAEGAFCGSESLGVEGSDHLQFFPDLEALRGVLGPHFAHVELTEIEYQLPSGTQRREAFWRCGHGIERLRAARWQDGS
jgi:SAM-dependent methyltransferase